MSASILGEVREQLERRGYRVEQVEGGIRAWHSEAPLALDVRLEDNRIVIELHQGDLREYLGDLVETGSEEEVREQLEEIIDDLSDAALLVESIARKSGLNVESRVRRDSLDVLEMLEDIIES